MYNLRNNYYYKQKNHKFPEARAMCVSQTTPLLTQYTVFKGSQLPQTPFPLRACQNTNPKKANTHMNF